jgi:uncharacterized membrane protein YbhN (UPF0104 family)
MVDCAVQVAPTVSRPTVSRPIALVASVVATSVGLVAWGHRAAINTAISGVRDADRHWLSLAVLAVVALWICGAITQIGVLRETPPIGRLFAVQVAASFMNSLLPAGVGGMAVNVRFLRRHGVGTKAGMAAVGLNSFAGLVAHLALLFAVMVSLPGRFHMIWQTLSTQVHDAVHHVIPGRGHVALAFGGLVMAAALVVRARRRRAADRAAGTDAERRTLGNEIAELRVVMRSPGRAAALWLGALATPVLHGLIIYAALRSLDVHISVVTAVACYVTVSGLAGLVPAPGGLGTFDVLLGGALVAVGVPGAGAVGAVVAYRLLTVWLPLVPAGCVFAVLMRRAII